jgi:ABC-2 type transport system ATP-binding protein
MQVRLAFSIAIRAESDILLLDEVLAVGDAIFQKKCYDYFKQLKKDKRTVVFVSHDTAALQEYCDRGILIHDSKLLYEGKIDKVITRYVDILTREEERQSKHDKRSGLHRVGSGEIVVKSIKISSDKSDKSKTVFNEKDSTLFIKVSYRANEDVDEPIYGISILDTAGQRIFVTNNLWKQQKAPALKKGKLMEVTWKIPNFFNSGTFAITPAVAGSGGSAMFDQVEAMLVFKIRKRVISNAYVNAEHIMELAQK